MDQITLIRPDDFHLHLRDGEALGSIIGDTARQFARAMVMPNLKTPVTTVEQAIAYRQRIIACLPAGSVFEPLMTLYLTDNTTADEIRRLHDNEFVHAVKYYPAGATTNSDQGVTSITRVYPVLETMAELDIPLLVHGEVTDAGIDIFDREQVFIEYILAPLMLRCPDLRIVFEHITTREAIAFVRQGPDTLAATITPHHMIYNRNALFDRGIRPHHYCMPVLKREAHRLALIEAATSGNRHFFLGTDSAPHARQSKESDCGCAGIYSAHTALEFYTEIFDQAGRLPLLERFASINGAEFYQLPVNSTTVTLKKTTHRIPASLAFGTETVIPLRAGESCQWMIKKNG
jgi:dihydroorotase